MAFIRRFLVSIYFLLAFRKTQSWVRRLYGELIDLELREPVGMPPSIGWPNLTVEGDCSSIIIRDSGYWYAINLAIQDDVQKKAARNGDFVIQQLMFRTFPEKAEWTTIYRTGYFFNYFVVHGAIHYLRIVEESLKKVSPGDEVQLIDLVTRK